MEEKEKIEEKEKLKSKDEPSINCCSSAVSGGQLDKDKSFKIRRQKTV